MAEQNYAPSPSPASSPLADAYRLHGRDSPAGKALYKLYGGDKQAKKAGLSFSQANRERHQAKLDSGWTPPPIEPPPRQEVMRPSIAYPKFGHSKLSSGPDDFSAPVDQIPRRRRADVIQAALAEEAEHQRRVVPLPRGPLLGEAEKQRCADAMRFRGKVPEITPEQRAAQLRARKASQGKNELETLQDLFDATLAEIEERKQFLAEMEAKKALSQDRVHQIRAEIRQRVDDMQKIDRLIQQIDV
jgi:hypothetical protein